MATTRLQPLASRASELQAQVLLRVHFRRLFLPIINAPAEKPYMLCPQTPLRRGASDWASSPSGAAALKDGRPLQGLA